MQSFKRSLIAGITGLAMLAGCGGGSHGGVVPNANSTLQNPVGNSPQNASFRYGQQMLAQLPYVGSAGGGNLSVTVSIRMRNAQGLIQYAAQANDPKSPLYRQWLSPQEIGDKFGATQSDYQAAAKYFAGYGLKVGVWPQREALSVSGSVGQFQRAFGARFGVYKFKGKNVVALAGAPHFASTVPVTGSSPIMTASLARPFFIHGNNANFAGYSPQQVATGFDFSAAYAKHVNGSGVNVGIIGTGPIIDANGADNDIAAYGSFWHAAMAPVTQVAVSPQPANAANGQTGTGVTDPNPTALATPPPITAPCAWSGDYTACNPEDGEAQLDTESISSLAPGSSVQFYLAYNPAVCEDQFGDPIGAPSNGTCPSGQFYGGAEGIQLIDDEYQQAIADNRSDVISMSFGEPENDAAFFGYIDASQPGLGQVEMASFAAEGVALFASSGDNGAWECYDPTSGLPLGSPCANYPASDPNVVAVGGVNIPLDENGNLIGEIAAWADNTTLGGDPSLVNSVGSGGGVSTVFAAPSWQSTTVGTSMRKLPDMSLDADPLTGQSVLEYASLGGALFASGGTSMAAPEAAAQWALVLQACKANASCNKPGTTGYRLGNPSPLLYAIYGTSTLAKNKYSAPNFTPQLTYEHVFSDVIYGGNQAVPATPGPGQSTPPPTTGYESGPGYDEVTGLGAPFTGHLIQAITGTKVP
jgi:pseudomonalisin